MRKQSPKTLKNARSTSKKQGEVMTEALVAQYGFFMTVEELADLLKTNKQTVYNKLYDDSLGIPHWRNGKRYLFPTGGVADYIGSQIVA